MSATGRSAVRDPADYYATPAWCVHRLLEHVTLPGGLWLEPCAGEGAIMHATAAVRSDVIWHAVEVREECMPTLDAIPTCQVAVRGGFLTVPVDRRYAVVLTNPPYASALRFVQHSLGFAPIVVVLLRLNWLSSAKRAGWLRGNMPSVYVLPDRPCFVGDHGDATDYAWMAWGIHERPTVELLATTPASERAGKVERERGQLSLLGDAA